MAFTPGAVSGSAGPGSRVSVSAGALLGRLERARADYGTDAARRKLVFLRALARAPLARARDVSRLHEVLCFLRAYPDDARVLAEVERMLGAFERRADVLRHRDALADSGIAGTEIRFRFFEPTARWIAGRWPGHIRLDWDQFENAGRLEVFLPLLALEAEIPGLDEFDFGPRAWIERMRGRRDSDAAFLIRRFAALRLDPAARERLYDELDPPVVLSPGPDTPARTRARYDRAGVTFQAGPLSRERPRLAEDVERPPLAIRAVNAREGARLIDLAREAMVTRSRDLDAFAWADPDDVRLVDCGGGLQFACMGVVPERRLLLDSVYGYLTLRNGVPIGYVLSSALFGSVEVAYNVFETYRGAEAGPVYGRVLAMLRRLFHADAFTVYPYQLGDDNDEALASGAWWFYQKLGFRPRDPGALRLMRSELRRMRRRPSHRSSIATLRRLAAHNVYWHLGAPRDDVMGLVQLARVGLHVTRSIALRFGADRERAARVCAREAARTLDAGPDATWSPGERLAWLRWAPLVTSLSGVERWPAAQKRAFAAVVRAKGGRRESEFCVRFDRHPLLRRAILRLAGDRAIEEARR
ncbi:MAG: hypothetical protein A2W00_01155 [Candidatus Eisenbacteria bacterium RBG_16_71_46]|nr:MAG: hypothetical protein A2W00_01155 [Candidatus Eisenbacteria bacterium RBG_16_71_46]